MYVQALLKMSDWSGLHEDIVYSRGQKRVFPDRHLIRERRLFTRTDCLKLAIEQQNHCLLHSLLMDYPELREQPGLFAHSYVWLNPIALGYFLPLAEHKQKVFALQTLSLSEDSLLVIEMILGALGGERARRLRGLMRFWGEIGPRVVQSYDQFVQELGA